MVKEKSKKDKTIPVSLFLLHLTITFVIVFFMSVAVGLVIFENTYQNKIYPGVKIDGMNFGGKLSTDVESFFQQKSLPFQNIKLHLTYDDQIATVSSTDLDLSYDGKFAALQAISIGRSGNILSDLYLKWKAKTDGISLSSMLKMNNEYLDETLNLLSNNINIESQDALFQFSGGKVAVFKPSKSGRRLDIETGKKLITSLLTDLDANSNEEVLTIPLPIETVLPSITTENSNEFGIRELLGRGTSKFVGSIPGRVHNIELAAARLNGKMIPPGEIFSFNDALGDVSATTGYQPAYIIKDGRTILGDGGGVCQVSTTVFRAALYSGLPIVERHAHSYRVSYYEQDSGPGIDATVFAPSYDLKFKNDTPAHILIQAKTDRVNYTLTFEFFGTSDGRKAEVGKPVILSQSAPPPDLYQDDPTLSKGVVKQVDWKAWGAKVTFDYKVTKDSEVIFDKTFFSNFQPWQAVFLRGTRE